MGFWIAASGMMVGVFALLVLALFRTRTGAESASAFDLRVYRDQLKEVDRDVARGMMSAEDAERARTEISRRILEADRGTGVEEGKGEAPRRTTLIVAAIVGLTLILGSVWTYGRLGAPGYPDLSLKTRVEMADELRKTRPGQDLAEQQNPGPQTGNEPDARYLDLMTKLRTAVAERPDDQQGQFLLARNEAALGNYTAAYAAQTRLIELKADAATAEDYASLADLMVLAAGGYVSPEAEQVLTQSLQRDPRNGTSRYYSGLMFAQTGRPDMAFRIWRPLLEESTPDAPWVGPIQAQIVELAQLAGVDYTLPAQEGAPGPSSADVANAAEMSDADRQEMIRGMVTQLNDRLATEGGTADEWARLIGALSVLGETDRARAIWTEAQDIFADRSEDLTTIRIAAERAGILE